MLLTEGAMALTLIHGGRDYIDAAAALAKRLMRQSPPGDRLPACPRQNKR